MAYDAIRDTHSSRSPSTTPVLDTHYPFPPGQSMNAPGRNGASPHYQEMSSPYERQPYPGQFERQASSRPGSSGGLRGLLNDEEEPGIFPERRSSGSTQGQIPSHRREYRHPSIGSVLGGAGSPGSMGEGRSLSMLLNGPTTLATPSSTTAMTPGMTPSHYPSPSPLGSNIRSPRFAVPTSAGGQTREYPFPPTPSGSSQHTSRPSPALYGLYNPQKSPTYRSRPLPPTAMDSQTGFPLSGYRPPSRGAPGKAPSPSPSVTSIHNLISPTSENKPYRSPSTEARSLYGMSMVGQPQTRTGTPSDSYSHTNSMPISRSTSGGLLLDPDSRDYTRQSSVHMEGPVSISPDRERERPERRSSIMGWTGEPSMSMSIPMSTSIPSRSFNLSGLISPSNELEPPSQDVIHRSRRLSVIDLASPSQNPIPLESSSNNKEINRAHTVAETNNENAMMDVDIPDGASALDVLASLSERAGSSRIREDDIQRKQKRESVSGVEVEEVKVAEKTEAPVSITVPSPRVEKKDEDMQADVDGDESSDQVPAEVLRNRKIESEMTPEQKEQQELVVQVAPQEVASSERDQPGSTVDQPESTVDQPESIVDRPQTSFKPKPSQPPSPLAESMALSPSARAASPFAQDENDQTTPRQTTPIDLAAQIFPADEKPEPLPAPVAIPEPAAIPVHSGKTEYKPRRLTAPLSVLQPLSAEDMAWYSDARNCLNPLRRGCPFKTMAEGKQRLSGPPGGEGASSSLNGLKRARDSPYTNGDDKQEQDNGWALKRARRGPVEALNEQSEVAAHYNARGNTGRAARTQSATYGLKTCNNWIKSVLIARFTRRRPGVSDFDPEDRSLRPNGRVLDMGCGKGGDIDKWNRAKIEEYVGIDVASGSIQDFNERIQSSRRRLNFRPHLYVLDCFSFPISVAVPRALLEPKFDTISMQFCMHYAFESEKKVRQMLENISNSLRIGGTFLGTTLSAARLLDLLSHIPEESEELSIGNPYYNIVFDKRDYEGTYGHSYRFTLVEAVEDCAEFIVHWEAFRELALSYGLKEVYRKDFDEVFAEEQTKPESVKLAERMGVTTNGHLNMDAEQWSACSIYMAFAFMKVK